MSSDLQEQAKRHLWMHFTRMGSYESGADVPVIVRGEGCYVYDEEGKRSPQGLFALTQHSPGAERIGFLDNYDLGIAAQMVAGCDLWVNLPRPPLEASGTSGMKSALNGGLNLSILDGWWAEAFDGDNGWGLPGEVVFDTHIQDERDGRPQPLEYEFKTWLACGITSVRDVGSNFSKTLDLRASATD